MKRGRTEEIQFGQARAQPPPGQQRIITTTQSHNVTSNTGSTIQYQIPPNVIKTATPSDSASSVTNLSSQSQQTAQLAPPQQTVQYTTTYNSTIAGNLVKSQQQATSLQQSQQQQIHLVNTATQVRGAAVSHKGSSVVNASPVNTTGVTSGAPTGGVGIVGVAGGQIITSMSPGVQPQGQPQPAQPQGQAQLQRLKVEDALSYLDQVKYRFGNQPQVYNDFLDIMKEFKSQSIDTPGVIQRVSNLFKGHPELIVGFNTFLPPGYKIELQANDQGYAFQVSVSMPSASTTGTSIAQQPSPHKYNTIFQGGGQIVQSTGGGANVANATGTGATTAVNLMAYGSGHAGTTVGTAVAAPNANVPTHGGTPLQQPTGGSVGNASPATAQNAQSMATTNVSTGTVPQVPQNFSSRGDHHQQQQQHHRERTISTGSVASNASLPPGAAGGSTTTTSTLVTAVDASPQQQQSIHRMISQQIISQQQQTGPATPTTGAITTSGGLVSMSAAVQGQPQHPQQQTTVQQQQQQTAAAEAQTTGTGTVAIPTSGSSSAAAAVATANQPVEFNHAISYVNKIKNRFHTEPEKYKRFLEILHTYQKEQKTYKEGALAGIPGCMTNAKQLTEAEVYTQVAQLFDNQEDLLREFGQFLPDATGHHNQVATQHHQQQQQQLHVSSSNKSNHIFVNAVLHDSHQQQQLVQTGTTAAGVGAVGTTTGTVVHSGGGKKLGNSSTIGGAGSGLTNASLKVYNSMQQANMARLQQERDYSPMGCTADGKDYSIVPTIPPGTIHGGVGVGGRGGGSVVSAGGAVLMEKDRNHIGGGLAGTTVAVGGGGLNAKYIHGTSLATIATGAGGGGMIMHGAGGTVLAPATTPGVIGPGIVPVVASLATSSGANAIKRSPSYSSQIGLSGAGGGGSGGGRNMDSSRGDRGDGCGPPPMKRHKPICRDVSLAEASKYGTLNDYAFFDKVRKALRSPDSYENFLRCLTLYNQEIVSKSELLTLVSPFLSRFPDLLKWFQDFLGPASSGAGSGTNECIPLTAAAAAAAARQDRSQGELAADIDLSTCKRLGASYCALPKSLESVKCSGRTGLCRDVLNDIWVSFPTWAEDSTFVTSRKTQYEEFIYRCEDERFELDVVIETNSATIRVLEGIQKKLTRMSQDEISRFRLDDCLGGTSTTIHQRALKRIYGDKAADMIQGLKKNPAVAVPVVLRRMKAKEEEWREAQKSFNKQWRDQNEKYYLKSLDHQGINFKQTDIKALRSKSLFNEIETLFDERHEQNDDTSATAVAQSSGPHMTIPYKDKTILEDAANLLIHHVKRQTGIQKQEKARIKHILRQFVPDLFFAPRQQLSEDEREEDEKDADGDQDEEDCSGGKSSSVKKSSGNSNMSCSVGFTPTSSNNCNPNSNTTYGGTAVSSSSSTSIEGGVTYTKDDGSDNSTIGDGNIPKTTSSPASSSTEAVSAAGTSAAPSIPSVLSGSGSSVAFNADSNGSGSTNEGPKADKQMTIKMEIKDENEATLGTGGDGGSTASAAQQEHHSRDSAPAPAAGTQAQQPMSPPLPPHAVSKHIEEAYTLFFTNNNWYLFLRLHAILCERLRTIYERAQIIAAEERAYESTRNSSTATALRLKPKSEIRIEEYYNIFLDMLKNLLDGNMESSSFEDTLREMFGIHAYIAFTLDRVVQNAVRQLQHCVTERGASECVELYQVEQRRGGAGGLCRTANRRIAAELGYQRKAESALQDENCFKIYIYKIDCRVTIELLDTESDDTANNFANSQTYNSFVDRLSNPAATGTGSDSGGGSGAGGVGMGASGHVATDGNTATNIVGGSSGGSASNNHNNNTAVGINTNTNSSAETGGSAASGVGGDCRTGGSTGSAEIKTEKSDDEMGCQQPVEPSSRRRPVFLPRNVRQRRKVRPERSPTNDKRFTVESGSKCNNITKENSSDENTVTLNSVPSSACTTTSKSKLLYSNSTTDGAVAMVTNPATGAELSDNEPLANAKPSAGAASTVVAKDDATTKCASGFKVGPSASSLVKNTATSNINRKPSNASSGRPDSRYPLWGAGSSKSSLPDRLPDRLPNHNGVDRNIFYIEDTEQVKVNRSFKTSLVESKNFTLFRRGSLMRSRKSHPKVTTRMHRKFQAVVNRWLEEHVSASQRASCVDWLLGKRQDLTKNLTTMIVNDEHLNRTPYKPYNRYKVDHIETTRAEEV